MKKRIVSLALAMALCFSFITLPANAVEALPGEVTLTASNAIGVDAMALVKLLDRSIDMILGNTELSFSNYWCDSYYAANHHVFVTYESLNSYAAALSSLYTKNGWHFWVKNVPETPYFAIHLEHYGDINDKLPFKLVHYLADSSGNALFASKTNGSASSEEVTVPDTVLVNDTAMKILREARYHQITYEQYLDKLNDPLTIRNTTYYWYTREENGKHYIIDRSYHWIRCDPAGVPYVYVDQTAQSVQNTIRETTEVYNDLGVQLNETVVNVGADLTTAITDLNATVNELYLNLPLGGSELIQDCYYDCYNDSYEYYTYDITEDSYNTYVYKYYTNYTYVYNLGETSEFEAYKCYYQLPDGRSSADLTREELEQLSCSVDVCNYVKVSEDNRLRALYHFDGNLDDSSYWSYANSVNWNNYDASITYNDVGTFGGALYLPNDVPYTLSFNFSSDSVPDLSGDWTVEFRLYAGLNGSDSSLKTFQCNAFGYDQFRLYGDTFTSSGVSYANGVWNHIALVKKGSSCKIYCNGVEMASGSIHGAVTNSVTFTTAESASFYMIDELRVSSYAVYTCPFTPSAVPFDSNLVLVTPDVVVDSSEDEVELVQLDSIPVAASFVPLSDSAAVVADNDGLVLVPKFSAAPVLASSYSYYKSTFTLNCPSDPNAVFDVQLLVDISTVSYRNGVMGDWTLSDGVGTLSLSDGDSVSFYISSTYNFNPAPKLTYSLCSYDSELYSVEYSNCSQHSVSRSGSDSASITLTSLAPPAPTTGDLSISFSLLGDTPPVGSSVPVYIGFDDNTLTGTYGDVRFSSYSGGVIGNVDMSASGSISVTGVPAGVSYEVRVIRNGSDWTVSGPVTGYIIADRTSSVSVSATYTSPVIPDDPPDIPVDPSPDPPAVGDITYSGKPILAVKSDIPVSNYQLGGVRPTYPKKGMVYALIESGYITSLQIYTGYVWDSVDGRIYTGSRWVPYSFFNMITLSDMYDIADASGHAGYEYIYTESGFWDWWQHQWLDFKNWYSNLSFVGGGSSTTITEETIINNEYSENNTNVLDTLENSQKSVWDILTGIFDIVGNVFSETPEAMEDLTGAFDAPDLEAPDESIWYLYDVPYEFMSPTGS